MQSLKQCLAAAAAAASLGLGLAAMSAGPAAAYVACNGEGDCWHTDSRVHYHPGWGVVTHPDAWYFHQHWDDHHRWREEHEGRGYWRNGVWITF